jgi:hypothetical protein
MTEETFEELFSTLYEQFEKMANTAGIPSLDTENEGWLNLLQGEYDDLNEFADRALGAMISSAGSEVIRAALALIPTFHLKAAYWGMGADARVGGGDPLATVASAVTTGFNIWQMIEQFSGTRASKKASYERRAQDWLLQSNLAAHELAQIGRQLIGSLISEQVARHDYETVKKQIEQSEAIDQELHDKFSSEALYGWMQGEMSKLYYEYYRFAFDTARKAEKTMKRELMRPEIDTTDYIKFNYWDAGRKGLLSGEALYLDIKRMEAAYHENNKREFEMTKHVSLKRLNPVALLTLKAAGVCEVSLPEWLFDMDGPGHYMRRIKNVSLSIPSVIGPYTSVNCTLSLLRSSIRKSPLLSDGEYPRQGSEDTRFQDTFGTIQSVVTSSANNDSGMFDPNLRDERFLPFEGAGAESRWKLQLPQNFRQFDYNTITDVILHMQYTARQGGDQLREKAETYLSEAVAEANASGLAVCFCLSHDFPNEWHQFLTDEENFTTSIKRDDFPYFTQGREIVVDAVRLLAIKSKKVHTKTLDDSGLNDLTDALNEEGAFVISVAPDGEVLKRESDNLSHMLIKYSLAEL